MSEEKSIRKLPRFSNLETLRMNIDPKNQTKYGWQTVKVLRQNRYKRMRSSPVGPSLEKMVPTKNRYSKLNIEEKTETNNMKTAKKPTNYIMWYKGHHRT